MAFARIVVGVDAEEGGRDAAALAGVLASPGAAVALVHAFPAGGRMAAVSGLEETMREQSLEWLAAAERACGLPGAELVAVADPSPARVLQRLAAERDADLLVIGSSRRGPVGRVLLGDVSRSTLDGAPCAVAVAPHDYRESPGAIRTIGVGYDGGDASTAALETAREVAAASGAALRVRTVVAPAAAIDPGYGAALDLQAFDEQSVREAQAALDAVAGGAEGVTTDVVVGQAGAVLEELSAEVDLMVVGSRGWGAVRRVVLGSAADRLVHESRSPVLVVPGS